MYNRVKAGAPARRRTEPSEAVSADKRTRRERAIVRGMLRYLGDFGWYARRVYDGSDTIPPCGVTGERNTIETVFSTCYASVHFMRANVHQSGHVLLIAGNGEEIISDYGGPPDFRALVDDYLDSL